MEGSIANGVGNRGYQQHPESSPPCKDFSSQDSFVARDTVSHTALEYFRYALTYAGMQLEIHAKHTELRLRVKGTFGDSVFLGYRCPPQAVRTEHFNQ